MLAARHGRPSESFLWRWVSSKTPPSAPESADAQQQPPRHGFKGTWPPQSHALCRMATGTGSPGAATTFHGYTGVNANPSSRTAAVTVHM